MLISALDGPLPRGTTVTVTYGSGREQFEVGVPASPEILFCEIVDREGNPVEGSPSGGAGGEGPLDSRSEGGAGGTGSQPEPATIEALRCALWTQGPATIEIIAEGYPTLTEELKRSEDSCTLTTELMLVPEEDAGT